MKITVTPKIAGQMNLDELEALVRQARQSGLPGRSTITVRLKGIGRIREISVDGDNLSYQSPFDQVIKADDLTHRPDVRDVIAEDLSDTGRMG